ncbi:MAG TPA: 16S rRNA (cytosine(1402)-N(4))-methyltransferase RsmH [Nitrospira sp.]|nr:16S rRNA (cytosine(1402)-N(4))-methyltransferase RsmH [Nitrospira sp.]
MNFLLTTARRGVYSATKWEKVGEHGEQIFSGHRAHIPVMVSEVLHWLRPSPSATILDCTVGYCGHAEFILAASDPTGILIGIDRDPVAIEESRRRMERFRPRLHLVQGHFVELKRVLADRGISQVQGVLFDLGASSPQFDDPARGFSFQAEGPLDMRMDQTAGRTAADIVNRTAENDLADIIFQYGEERYSRRIARALIRAREERPITMTAQLASVVWKSVPARYRNGRLHPATRTFQALRIAVNQELDHLDRALRDAVDVLTPGGRICVISFHSLEDRIVKRTFRSLSGRELKILTRKPQLPADAEVERNPRARSAKLRVGERIMREGHA